MLNFLNAVAGKVAFALSALYDKTESARLKQPG
jgi:hypothetical protein